MWVRGTVTCTRSPPGNSAPLTTTRLRDAYDMLEDASDEVSILVISVDPERDDVEAARDYSKRWNMEERWDYFVGDRDTLSETWSAYFVAASVEEDAGAGPTGGADAVEARPASKAYSRPSIRDTWSLTRLPST